MKKILFFLFTCALTIGSVQAQEAADSIKIYYRRGYRNVDPSFRDNRSQLEYFLNSIGATLKNDRVEKIVIRSYASPDGAVQANEQLAARRAGELKAYWENMEPEYYTAAVQCARNNILKKIRK